MRKDLVTGNYFQTRRTAPSETNELGGDAGRGRGASGGEIFNGRGEAGKNKNRGRLDRNRRRGGGNFNRGRVHLAVREHRDRAIVVGLARVLVDHFVQRGRRRHRVQQQDKADEQRGENRLAVQA